ncbi:MAG: hypothetical protein GF372_10775 [Candidatus Marinimicrobia bacterium]|nr:hypothetical protein [Candidatus Neomarinimicrobiota bacterium]
MNRFLKYSLGSIALLAVLAIGYGLKSNWILFQPDKVFQHSLRYNEFLVYSDEPLLEKRISPILDDVSWRLESTLDYEKGQYNIYLCNRPETFEKFTEKVGRPQQIQGFNLQPLNYVFINLTFVQDMKSRNSVGYQYHILEGNPAHVISHEICHQLIADKIGYFKMRTTSTWKLEGFCEYSASKRKRESDSSFQFSAFAADFFDGKYNGIPAGRKFYLESLLVTAYYLDIKNRSFDDLMNDNLNKAELLEEIRQISTAKSL